MFTAIFLFLYFLLIVGLIDFYCFLFIICTALYLDSMWSCEVQRIREYLNRGVTTVDFDKKRPTRTTQDSVSIKTKEMTMVL